MTRRDNNSLCPDCKRFVATFNDRPLRSSKDILACLEHFRDKRQEYFVVLSLDSGQRLIACRVVSSKPIVTTLAHPREVFAEPLVDRAASVIIAHNHPSGVASPSDHDISLTQQLAAAGQLLGIPLKDHVIITLSGHFSFKGHGLLA